MPTVTYYDILDIPMRATAAEVRQAYIRRLVQCHPERHFHDNDSVTYNPNAELDAAVMQLVDRAYTVLRDPVRRAQYDQQITGAPSLSRQAARSGQSPVRVSSGSENASAARGVANVQGMARPHNGASPHMTQALSTLPTARDSSVHEVDGTTGAVLRRPYVQTSSPPSHPSVQTVPAVKTASSAASTRAVDPRTNARYSYERSPDGAVRSFSYYYNAAEDPSLVGKPPAAPAARVATTTDSDASQQVVASTASVLSPEELMLLSTILPRRARILLEQILSSAATTTTGTTATSTTASAAHTVKPVQVASVASSGTPKTDTPTGTPRKQHEGPVSQPQPSQSSVPAARAPSATSNAYWVLAMSE